MDYEYREEIVDGRRVITPYIASKPMSAREAMDDSRPLPDLALWILGWGPYADGSGYSPPK